MNSRIAEYLEQQIIENIGETRPYIDPDNITVMADEIVKLFAIPVVSKRSELFNILLRLQGMGYLKGNPTTIQDELEKH